MSDLLVIESKYVLRGDKYTEIYEVLVNQKANGLVLLLPGMTAKIIPEDVNVYLTDSKVVPETLDLRRRWIPCSERLPEEDGKYLVTVDFLKTRVTLTDFVDGTWSFHSDDDVIAWMPMPEVYKEEK